MTKRKMPSYSTLESPLNEWIFEMTYFSGHMQFKSPGRITINLLQETR